MSILWDIISDENGKDGKIPGRVVKGTEVESDPCHIARHPILSCDPACFYTRLVLGNIDPSALLTISTIFFVCRHLAMRLSVLPLRVTCHAMLKCTRLLEGELCRIRQAYFLRIFHLLGAMLWGRRLFIPSDLWPESRDVSGGFLFLQMISLENPHYWTRT
jgi:hypothetical protein